MSAIKSTGLLTRGLRSDFFAKFNAKESHYQKLATRLESNAATETYKFLGQVPKMREMGQGRVSQGVRTETYSIENLEYEATMEVDRTEIEDDQTGQIKMRVAELASKAATHKDYLIGLLLANGATTGYNSYDGVSFFNATHASGASGNQSNLLTSSGASPSSPTTAEFKAAFGKAVQAMLAYKDDLGDPMNIGASGLAAIVPPNMLINAMEALKGLIVGNNSNIIASMADVVCFPWLTDTDKWFLAKTDEVIRPFVFQDRMPIEFQAKEQDSDGAFFRSKYHYGVRARYRMTYGYWQYCVRTQFT